MHWNLHEKRETDDLALDCEKEDSLAMRTSHAFKMLGRSLV